MVDQALVAVHAIRGSSNQFTVSGQPVRDIQPGTEFVTDEATAGGLLASGAAVSPPATGSPIPARWVAALTRLRCTDASALTFEAPAGSIVAATAGAAGAAIAAGLVLPILVEGLGSTVAARSALPPLRELFLATSGQDFDAENAQVRLLAVAIASTIAPPARDTHPSPTFS